jgi:hypothetical protein
MTTILNNLLTTGPHDNPDLDLERERLVLDIRLEHLPLSHPLVATMHLTLVDLHFNLDAFDEASQHYSQGLRLKLKYLPNDHLSIISAYLSTALMYLYKEDYEAIEDQKEMTEKS